MLASFEASAGAARSTLQRVIANRPGNEQVSSPSQCPAATRFIGGMVTGTAAHIEDIGPAARAVIDHPGNMHDLSRFLGDFAAIAATVGTAAAIAAFPADGPVAVVLDGLARGGDDAYLGTMGAKTELDLTQWENGDVSGADVLDDVADIGLDGGARLGARLTTGAALDETAPACEAATTLRRALAEHPGVITAADVRSALAELPAAERAGLQWAGVDLTDPAQAFIGLARAEREAAEQDARALGAVNAAISYDGGAATDQAHDVLIPDPAR